MKNRLFNLLPDGGGLSMRAFDDHTPASLVALHRQLTLLEHLREFLLDLELTLSPQSGWTSALREHRLRADRAIEELRSLRRESVQ
jgi:hypothetical protein